MQEVFHFSKELNKDSYRAIHIIFWKKLTKENILLFQIHEDEPGQFDECDDEGAQSHRADVVADQTASGFTDRAV